MAVFWHVGATGFLWEGIVQEQMTDMVSGPMAILSVGTLCLPLDDK
jgi:hypothetical protein